MATALESVSKLTIRRLTRGFNQASILEAEHALKKDDPAALQVGTEVTYTDDDLGFVFRGRVVDIREQWSDGEGIIYLCADRYRRLVKTPATINGSSKIRFSENTTAHTVLTTLLDELPSDMLPGGYALGTLPDIPLPKMDKGGQSIDNWINEVLRHTEDGVCWIEYVDVSGELQPKLMFASMATIGTVDLQEGNYNQIDPTENDSPLIVEGALGESLEDKYGEVRIEGCGNYERRHLLFIPQESVTQDPDQSNKYIFKYIIPDDFAVSRYLDENCNCKEDAWVRVQLGVTADLVIGQTVFDMHNIPIYYDEANAHYYFEITIIRTGIFSVSPPPAPVILCWFTYTALENTFTISLSTGDSRLVDEGTYIEQHPELYRYYDSGASGCSIDFTAAAYEMLSALYDRYCVGPDRIGDLTAHIKGLDPDMELGAEINDPSDLNGTTIRGITYDFITRNMILETSNRPLQSEVFNAQRRQEIASELGGNWYLPKPEEDQSCFCGGPLYTDEDGTLRPGPGAPGGGGQNGPTWDCLPNGNCQQRNDNLGAYPTLAACEADCNNLGGWIFVPCVGCVPVGENGGGDYETEADCENDNPDPFDPSFDCDGGASSGSSGSPPDPGSGSGEGGTTYDCLGCGDGQVGFIKTIKVDKGGRVVSASCATCTLPSGSASCDCSCSCETSGYTGTFSVVTDVTASCTTNGSQCWVTLDLTTIDLTFSNGLLQSAT